MERKEEGGGGSSSSSPWTGKWRGEGNRPGECHGEEGGGGGSFLLNALSKRQKEGGRPALPVEHYENRGGWSLPVECYGYVRERWGVVLLNVIDMEGGGRSS